MIEIIKSGDVNIKSMLAARADAQPDVTAQVKTVIDAVRTQGDKAVLAYTQQFDGVYMQSMRVSESEIDAACFAVGEAFMAVLKQAADNIRAFHTKQVRQGFVLAERPGVVMGQKITPLARVGLYVPGGTAAYPSTVLMDAIPAQIAGVERIIMVTPPGADGSVKSAEVLAAARVAGVTDIYKVGGAQAIAALAYGTESIPQVDKIVGPGNLYVATAKRLVYGQVDIDMIAGPSDILVVADESAAPALVAADMLGQAEHDENASAVLVTTSYDIAAAVQAELNKQLPRLPRESIAKASLERNGCIIVAEDMTQAMDIANEIAPEHMELCVDQPFELLSSVRNAGSIFLGHNTPEALGDYFAGPNHTLPTDGTARFSSPLSVDDFIKKSSYLYYSKEALVQDAQSVREFARREGLDAHANSVTLRVAPEEAL